MAKEIVINRKKYKYISDLEKWTESIIDSECYTDKNKTTYTIEHTYKHLTFPGKVGYAVFTEGIPKKGIYRYFITGTRSDPNLKLYMCGKVFRNSDNNSIDPTAPPKQKLEPIETFIDSIHRNIYDIAKYIEKTQPSLHKEFEFSKRKKEHIIAFGEIEILSRNQTQYKSSNAMNISSNAMDISNTKNNTIEAIFNIDDNLLKQYSDKNIENNIIRVLTVLFPYWRYVGSTSIIDSTNFVHKLDDITSGIHIERCRNNVCDSKRFLKALNRNLKSDKDSPKGVEGKQLSKSIETYFKTKLDTIKELKHTNIDTHVFCESISKPMGRFPTFGKRDFICKLKGIDIRYKKDTRITDLVIWNCKALGVNSFFGVLLEAKVTFNYRGESIETPPIILKIGIPNDNYRVQNEHDTAQMKREILMNRYAADTGIAPDVYFSVILKGENKKKFGNELMKTLVDNNLKIMKFKEHYPSKEHVMLMGMQKIEGKTLTDYKQNDQYKHANTAIKHVERLHKMGIIHGDLHTGNIMIEDTTKRVYVIDYGLSHSILNTPNFSYGVFNGNNYAGFVLDIKKTDNMWKYEREWQTKMLFDAANLNFHYYKIGEKILRTKLFHKQELYPYNDIFNDRSRKPPLMKGGNGFEWGEGDERNMENYDPTVTLSEDIGKFMQKAGKFELDYKVEELSDIIEFLNED